MNHSKRLVLMPTSAVSESLTCSRMVCSEHSWGPRNPPSLLCLFNQGASSSPGHCPNMPGFNSLTKRNNSYCFTHRGVETNFLLWKLEFLLRLKELSQFTLEDLTCRHLLLYYFCHGKFMFQIDLGLAGDC